MRTRDQICFLVRKPYKHGYARLRKRTMAIKVLVCCGTAVGFLTMAGGVAFAQTSGFQPARPDCQATSAAVPGEIIAEGWQRSYRAGCLDDTGKFAGGSETLHLVGHKGKLYAAVGYWMDPRNIAYGGKSPDSAWAQILRLDEPSGRWKVDLDMTWHMRPEILHSVTFTTNGVGEPLNPPTTVLLAGAFEGDGRTGVSLFTRDDVTGQWEKSKILAGPTGKRGAANSVRAMRVHRDAVTGVDRLFVSIGELGLFAGVYDPAVPGRIRWDAKPETGPLLTRPLAIVEANGGMVFSAGAAIYRRIDGPAPTYERIAEMTDLGPAAVESPQRNKGTENSGIFSVSLCLCGDFILNLA